MGVNLKINVKILLFQKVGKNNYKIVKFELENFELIKTKKDTNRPVSKLNLYIIGANIYSYLACAPFCAKNYGTGWMGGWEDGWVDGWVNG